MELEGIKNMSKSFRDQKDPLWIGVRRALVEKDIDIDGLIIADSFPEDVAMEYVLVVTKGKCVFEFYYDYLDKNESEGVITEWQDFTNNHKGAYMHESLDLALNNFDQI
jgi:hypothetical protein